MKTQKKFGFSQRLVVRRDREREAGSHREDPTRSMEGEMRQRKAEERGEPTRERGFLELNPARVRQGTWLLGVETYEQKNSGGGR
jgi:hypothetical protein